MHSLLYDKLDNRNNNFYFFIMFCIIFVPFKPYSDFYICVFSPALTDGSLGDMLFFHSFRNPGLVSKLYFLISVFGT